MPLESVCILLKLLQHVCIIYALEIRNISGNDHTTLNVDSFLKNLIGPRNCEALQSLKESLQREIVSSSVYEQANPSHGHTHIDWD